MIVLCYLYLPRLTSSINSISKKPSSSTHEYYNVKERACGTECQTTVWKTHTGFYAVTKITNKKSYYLCVIRGKKVTYTCENFSGRNKAFFYKDMHKKFHE